MLKNLGKRIRQIRKSKRITLIDLSEKTGVAQATLSRIETGTMTGTIESHEKIAEAMGVGLADLYSGIDSRYEDIEHNTQQAERKVTKQSSRSKLELLTQESSKKKITPLLVTLASKGETEPETNERGVEKFIFVLDGSITVDIEGTEYDLQKEETLYFDASLNHQIKNAQASISRFLMAVSPSKL